MELVYTLNLRAFDPEIDLLRLWDAARLLASLTFVISASPVAEVFIFSFSREYAALKLAWGGERKLLKIGRLGDIDYLC